MRAEILERLRDSGGYVSGQELCEQLGVSRTAVWKAINQLKTEGYEIEAVQNRGYRLKSVPEVLSESELKSRIHTEWAGRNLHFLQKTGSTNVDARHCMEQGEPHGTLVVADRQDAGRGRRGRGWESPAGQAVYMTIGLRPEIVPERASMLTLVMALSVAAAVEEETGLETMIKWPNDVVVNRRKICGILTEMSVESDYISYVVIGVGINANMEQFPQELADKATSLKLESGSAVCRASLIEGVMRHFEEDYGCFLGTQDLSELKERYEQKLVNCRQRVRILDPKGDYEGKALGIQNSGELIVELPDGSLTSVYAGEVSVRGYYGYV